MTRRELLSAAVATVVGTGTVMTSGHAAIVLSTNPLTGLQQVGITTSPSPHTVLASFDVVTERRQELVDLLRSWSGLAAKMPGSQLASDTDHRAEVTLGFGATLFELDGEDRFGIAAHRPPRLITMPVFEGDQLDPALTGGDLTVQVCALDRKTVEDGITTLSDAAAGAGAVRWVQYGFTGATIGTGPPRDSLGFKEGIVNPSGRSQMSVQGRVGRR